MVIFSIAEIQAKLSEVFKVSEKISDFSHASTREVMSPILRSYIRSKFLLDPPSMLKILEDYRRYDLHHEIIPLLACAWEIGFPIYLYLDLNMNLLTRDRDNLRDWRFALAYFLHKSKVKVDDGIWELLGLPPTSH